MSTVTNTPGRSLRLTCPGDLAAVREAARDLRAFLERQELSQVEVEAWELICVEAGNNAVEYAEGALAERPIEFIVEVSPGSVELRVLDHTPGFELPHHSALPNQLEEGGRGLFLIRSLSDSIKYWRGQDENCLVIRRQRPADGSPLPGGDASVEQAVLESTLHTMTEELSASYEILSAIFRFTEELSHRGGESAFLDRGLLQLQEISGADWFVLRLANDTGDELVVAGTTHPHVALPPLPLAGNLQPGPSVERSAVAERQDIWFDATKRPAPEDPLNGLGSNLAGLAHPLFVGGKLVGVLSMGRHVRAHPFTAAQVSIIHTLADFLGIQIRNVQFQAAQLQSQLLERDYELASRIQRQLLPKWHPRRGPWGTLGLCESAHRVGGDYYDVLEIGSHGLLLAVADVMGKGLPAALFATVFRTLLHARPDLARCPGAFIDWINQNLVVELGDLEMIITAQLAYVNLATRELRVAGAGHPPLLVAGNGVPGIEVLSSGPPLGIDATLEFHEERLTLPPGTRLLLYTDGVTEALDPAGLPVGTQPLMAILEASALRGESLDETIAQFARLPHHVERGRPLADDQTLLLLLEDTAPRKAPPAQPASPTEGA